MSWGVLLYLCDSGILCSCYEVMLLSHHELGVQFDTLLPMEEFALMQLTSCLVFHVQQWYTFQGSLVWGPTLWPWDQLSYLPGET